MKKTLMMTCLALFASHAFAAVSLLTSRAQITETDYIDWADAGVEFTAVPDPTVMTTHGTPFNVLVSAPSSSFERRDGVTGWLNGYAPGDPLLWNQTSNPLSLKGTKTCNDFGTEIQSDQIAPFNAHLDVYDGLGLLIGSFNVAGNGGGAATFIGAHSDLGDIHEAVLSVQLLNGTPDNFVINRVSYACCGAVPEPASLSALGLGALALLRKKRSK